MTRLRRGLLQSLTLPFFLLANTVAAAKDIAHDAEYYVLQAQNGDRWKAEDRTIDAEIADFRERNGGKPPNIFYILIDDIGFGDLGSETLNSIRGYRTPAINEFAREGMRLSRMYTELPGLCFLSGGLSGEDSTAYLSAMNAISDAPWKLSFSFGRGLQAAALEAWGGKSENTAAAMAAFSHRAKMNSLATTGEWKMAMEKAA